MHPKKKAVYVAYDADLAYSPGTQAELASILEVLPGRPNGEQAAENPHALADAQVILSSWGGPCLDAAFLAALPKLEAVFYAAGSVRGLVTGDFWARDIPICSAWAANAVPVAEFTLAQIILCLKHTCQRSRALCAAGRHVSDVVPPGNYGSRVGLIGLGMIGRMVAELLQAVLKVEVCAYDPVARPATAAALGVTLVELDALFRECDVVSLHAPSLESTRGMITGQHFGSMKPGASFINTARGAIVREPEMLAVLQARPDLFAVLDVTDPEPPAPDSPLYNLPNVFLTPHIAGSNGRECWRMGEYMLAEVRRFLAGEALFWRVTREAAELMA
jgi:phosphoglycerate dehydrogenase-like enzyme